MIQEILPDLYMVEIPLPDTPLKALNSYVLKAPGRNIVIDTGMDREECFHAMRSALEELGVDLKKTDFFITHLHADHIGLVGELASPASRVYFNGPDAAFLRTHIRWDEELRLFALKNGFPEDELEQALAMHPGHKYQPTDELDFVIVRDGDLLSAGSYTFRCVETPGHTRGHMCLYEPGKKILVSGDHLLYDITPNISLWTDNENPLRQYLLSLDKVLRLDVELVLPGHRSVFRDCAKRIGELKRHHQARNDEIISILESGGRDAYQVASRMSWDMTYPSWELFPPTQKLFATGEALAHLKHLEEEGIVHRQIDGLKVAYTL